MSAEQCVGRVMLGSEAVAVGKIVCVGRNYVAHIEELGNEVPDDMVLFAKPRTAIGDELMSRHDGEALHYEGEICFLVGDGAFVAVGFGLDLTKRSLQSRLKTKGLPWERAKAFDGAALFSGFATLDSSHGDLALELDIDGVAVQRGNAGQMMYSPDVVLAEIKRFMTLEDGDIVMTGTPSGVGEVRAGARFEGRVLADGQVLTTARWTAR